MILVLIRWKIRPEPEQIASFLEFWRKEAIAQDRRGLVGEFLNAVCTAESFPHITWDMDGEGGDEYKTYVNVGIWADAEAFHVQIGSYFNDNKPLKKFEFDRRVRTVLNPVCWRMGDSSLPIHDSGGVL